MNDAVLHRIMIEQGHAPTFVPQKPRKKRDNEEWRIQSTFFKWWLHSAKALGIWPGMMYHIPNGSLLGDYEKSRLIRSRMLTLAGMVNGVPDVFLCAANDRFHGLYIEFKKPSQRTAKNGGLSKDQQEFIAYAMGRGYQARVCYSWEEGRDAVQAHLGVIHV